MGLPDRAGTHPSPVLVLVEYLIMSKANRYDEFTIQEQENGPPLVVDRFGGQRTSTRVERALWEILNRDDDKARIAILKSRVADLERALHQIKNGCVDDDDIANELFRSSPAEQRKICEIALAGGPVP